MKTKPTAAGILILLLLLLTMVYAQEKSIDCKDIDHCINNHVNPIETSCINELGIGWGDECIEFQKKRMESIDKFNMYIRFVNHCRYLISKGECMLNTKECENILNRASSRFEYRSAGECYAKFGQCEKAEEHYKKAIKIYEDEENYVAIGMIYARLAACYNLKNNADKRREYYKKAGYNYKKDADELLKFYKEYPHIFDNKLEGVANASARKYLYSARAYKAANDYENACKSCQEANKYYRKINKPTIDCKQYGCNVTEIINENSEQLDHDIILATVIILITFFTSVFVIWYKKFKR